MSLSINTKLARLLLDGKPHSTDECVRINHRFSTAVAALRGLGYDIDYDRGYYRLNGFLINKTLLDFDSGIERLSALVKLHRLEIPPILLCDYGKINRRQLSAFNKHFDVAFVSHSEQQSFLKYLKSGMNTKAALHSPFYLDKINNALDQLCDS